MTPSELVASQPGTAERLKHASFSVSRRLARNRAALYVKQAVSTVSWRVLGERATEEAARVADELRRNGIAITTGDRLGFDGRLVQELNHACLELSESSEALERGRTRENSGKDFFFRLLGQRLIRTDCVDIFARVALDPVVLSIANDCLRCYSWLMRYNVWLNLPVEGQPKASQLWHRDYGANGRWENLVKMFFMISDLGADNGAFSYVPGTHRGGWRGALKPRISVNQGGANRTSDGHMREVVSEAEWVTPIGGPGTIIFTDTSGFHKGGYVRTGRRLLFKALYSRWLCTHGAMVQIRNLGSLRESRDESRDGSEELAGDRSVRWACSWR